MEKIKVAPNVYWVGAVDWNLRTFHGDTYNLQRGTTYNSYLIIDEKITLIDGVQAGFSAQWIERISEIVDPSKIDYIVTNHIEPDHSGSIPEIMKLAKNAKIFGTAKCKDGLFKYYYPNPVWDFQIVKSGDTLEIGSKTLQFIDAAMIHWPDSMFTYIPQDKLLIPNDAFGQHLASSGRFDDEVDQCALMDEAEKYYANILVPFSMLIARKIDELIKLGLKIDTIAPSHGIIWRKNPKIIVEKYALWSKNIPYKKAAVIVYETMWGSSEKMARAILEGIIAAGGDAKLYDIAKADRTEVIKDIFASKLFFFASSTHDNNILPAMAGFLDFVKGMKIKNRVGMAFGSFGWSGESIKQVEEIMIGAGIEIVNPLLQVKYAPSTEEIKKCFDAGFELSKKYLM